MITVMGATGHTGGEVFHALRRAGEPVRALGRSESRLAALRNLGAEARVGDVTDAVFLTDAFRDTDAVYALMPHDPQSPDYHRQQNRQGEALVKAIRDAGVRYVVFLSSLGADQPSGTGLLTSLHAQEQRLRQLTETNVLILRPGAFFENFFGMLDLIRHQEIIADSFAPDVQIPMIAIRDIAAAAAVALRSRDWEGTVVRELLGQRDLSYTEAAQIIGERIGKPHLTYAPLPYAEMVGALLQIGFSDDFARLYVEFTRAINDGTIRSREGRNPGNTTPTRFEDFAVDLASAYAAR